MIAQGAEIDRRLRVVSEMRSFLLQMRQNKAEAFARGEFPFSPAYDIRSDVEYWRKLRDQRLAESRK